MALAIVFCAVMMMKRVSTSAARAWVRTSRPERSGILMSIRATSKLPARSACRASLPLATATTRCPCWLQARSSTQRIDSSSSATRIEPPATLVLSGGVDTVLLADRQGHAKARPTGQPGFVRDRAAVLRDHAMAERQAEAAPPRLGREERREELGAVFLRDARAGVLHQHGEEAGASRTAADVKARLEAGRDDQFARSPERLEGVLHQVEEHLRQLRAVASHRRQARVEHRPQGDGAPFGCLPLEAEHVVQHAMDVDGLELQLRGDGELAELLDQAVEPLHLAHDDLRAANEVGIRDRAPQELGGALDTTERV